MSEPYVGEIRMFAGNFAPRAWAFCDGQLLAISQNDALFSLLGTIYGGDGRTTFGLPDMRGRVPISEGQGPGLSNRRIGSKGGSENETLTTNQIPNHNHGGRLAATSSGADSATPVGNLFAKSTAGPKIYHAGTGRGSIPTNMNAGALANVGGSRSHNNMAPTQTLNFIIALFGIYPSRN
jgi:microcystin-dependent protein